MKFQTGEKVEVIMLEEGFEGSYYAAKVISKESSTKYKVEYETLLKDDESGPLEEVVKAYQLRPVPPQIPANTFSLHQLADAYVNDGWWAGIIEGKFRSQFFVFFPSTDRELPFSLENLRMHQEWTDEKWINPERLVIPSRKNKKT